MNQRFNSESNKQAIKEILLPSKEQAYTNSLTSYFAVILERIQKFLSRDQPKKSQRHRDSPEPKENEIMRRAYFLDIVYQCLICLKQITEEWPRECSIPLAQPRKTHLYYEQFVNSLLLNGEQLTKLTRIKKCESFEEYKIGKINEKIISLLYETQIYCMQILLRIIIIKFSSQQRAEYLKDKADLHRKYAHKYFNEQDQTSKDKKSVSKDYTNLQLAKNKMLFKEINNLLNNYQLQISVNREYSKEKPEIIYLINFLIRKLTSDFYMYILQHCNLKIYAISSQIKQKQKSLQSYRPYTIPSHQYGETNNPELKGQSQQSLKRKKDIQYSSNKKQSQSLYSKEGKMKIGKNNEKTQKKENFIKSIKAEKQAESQYQKSKSEEFSTINKSQSSIHKSSNDLKGYIKEEKKNQQAKPKNNSTRQKLKNLGYNHNRFIHGACKFKYKSKSVKKQREIEEDPFEYRIKPEIQASLTKNRPLIKDYGKESQSSESYLAQETPVERRRIYMKPTIKK